MKKIRHIGIVVSDLKKSLHFYKDLLGLKVVKDMEESGEYIDTLLLLKNTSVRTIKMSADDNSSLIELLHFKSHPIKLREDKNITGVGCSHVAFTVDDIDFEYKRLKSEGILFNAPPQLSPDGYAKVTFCRDPDGTLIELVEVLQK